MYGQEVFSKGLPEALAEGWLAAPDYHIVFDDAVKEAMQSGFKATSLRALAELFDVQPRNEIIAKNIKEEMARIGLEFGEVKTIVFCQNIEHAEEMAELLGGKAYHSEALKGERRETFGQFKNGNLQVITTRDMFNEGVDVPDARLLVFLRSTSSQTIFEQQLGRGLRKNTGKESVSVLDFVANVERIAMIKELADKIKTSSITNGHGSSNGGNGDNHGSDGTIIDDPDAFGHGLTIHAGNADFDFDKMTVNLLEKYKQLMTAEPVPEGWMNYRGYANSVGISEVVLDRIMGELGLTPYMYRFGSKNGRAISPEQMELLETHPEVNIPMLPKGYITFSETAERLNVAPVTLRGYIDRLDGELPIFRTKSGSRAFGFSNLQLKELEAIVRGRGEHAEDGWLSINKAATHLDVARPTLVKAIKDLGLETVQRRFGPTTSDALSPEQVEALRRHPLVRVTRAPEGWLSIHGVAKKYGTTEKKVIEIAKELGVTSATHKFGPVVSEGLSPDDIEKIGTHPDTAEQAPEGWLTLSAAFKKFGSSPATIQRIVEEQGFILSDKYKFGPRRRAALNPEQVKILEAELQRRRKK